MNKKAFRGMVVSVGGAPSPVIFSLNHSKPDYICFFVSKHSRKMLEEEILPKLAFQPRLYDWIITPNAELLSECYSSLAKRLPEVLEKWDIPPEQICIDYTGGTKTMSAALVLATIEYSCFYSYVGGDERSKGGLGVVLDGKEKMYFLDNPWDEIALAEKKEVAILFNKARYTSAAEVLERCISKVSKEQKPFLQALQDMVMGYDFWDRFQHEESKRYLFKSKDLLLALSSEKRELKNLVSQMEENLFFLQNLLNDKKPSIFYFWDLLANAKRRADLEQKFDDAMARLYRALEVLGQLELKEKYGIETSNVKENLIPEGIRQEFISKYKDKDKGKIKIPLYASFCLLNELGNDLGKDFIQAYDKEIRPILDLRNSSILAHGFQPIKKETFEKMWEVVLKFSNTKEENLPQFPLLKI
ncbi:MAG: TIGR02710 family CRISPR-associated CARF protein [bacterium]